MVVVKLGVVYVDEVPNAVPPEAAAYHATVPAGLVGSVAVNLTVPAPHLDILATVGAIGRGLMVTVTLFLTADLQPVVKFLCTTQNKVVELTTGVINLFTPVTVPLCKTVVVTESAYQSIVIPVNAVAEMVAVSAPHFVAFTTVATVAGNEFTTAAAAVLVADKQAPLLAAA